MLPSIIIVAYPITGLLVSVGIPTGLFQLLRCNPSSCSLSRASFDSSCLTLRSHLQRLSSLFRDSTEELFRLTIGIQRFNEGECL